MSAQDCDDDFSAMNLNMPLSNAEKIAADERETYRTIDTSI